MDVHDDSTMQLMVSNREKVQNSKVMQVHSKNYRES